MLCFGISNGLLIVFLYLNYISSSGVKLETSTPVSAIFFKYPFLCVDMCYSSILAGKSDLSLIITMPIIFAIK